MADLMSPPGERPPSDRPESQQLTSARSIKPYRQGRLDGLCGLYAIINALRLLLTLVRPLTPSQCERLFRHGVSLIEAEGRLARSLYFGMGVLRFHRLTTTLVAEASRMSTTTIRAWRPYHRRHVLARDELMKQLQASIDDRSPVLMRLGGDNRHYTVLSGYTRTRLNLFDSAGHEWLHRSSCDVERDTATARHQINAGSLTVLGL